MPDPVEILVCGLLVGSIAFRIWRFVALDSLLARLRERLDDGFAHFIGCPWCLGFWLSVIVALPFVARSWSEAALIAVVGSVVVGMLGERTG